MAQNEDLLTRKELVDLLSLKSKLYKKDVKQFLEAFEWVLEEAILAGREIRFDKLGRITTTVVKAKPERLEYDFNLGKKVMKPPVEAYLKPKFSFAHKLKDRLREITKGTVGVD